IPSPFREKVRACPELDSGMRVIFNLELIFPCYSVCFRG
ncbi:MAG: hypothetical protein QG588_635, partial [Candidatus Poribacteria bacterium]|nr:hypothetical protein [Candidatus Poribacteria bacterium]